MKFIQILIISLFISVTHLSVSQQNLFNVQSVEITNSKKLFVQYQINGLKNGLQNNLTVDYGMGKNWEIGFNLFGADITNNNGISWATNSNNPEQPLNPQILFNAQKGLKIAEKFHIGVGTQIGLSMSKSIYKDKSINFNWCNTKWEIIKNKITFINGIYFGEKTYLGNGNRLGFMQGTEIALNKKFHFMADIIWGNNGISVCVPGFTYKCSKKVILSFGAQFPSPNSKNYQGFVFEFTWIQ